MKKRAASLLVFLLAVEILGQAYIRWTRGASLHTLAIQRLADAQASTAVFERHPYLVARPRANARLTRNGATITTTAIHTRVTGPAAPRPDATVVAVVGGSTTFGTKMTDADTWPWLLQQRLGAGYHVVNFGVPGYTTAEHVIQMALLVPEVKPAIVVFYTGWNDIRNYHWPDGSPDYYAHGTTQLSTLIPDAAVRDSLLARAGRYSFVIGLLNRAAGTPVGAAQKPPATEPDVEVDRVYLRNLQTLKSMASRFGMQALFVPQVMNSGSYGAGSDSRPWTPHIADASMPSLMRRFNGLMADLCANPGDRCAVATEVLDAGWTNDDFIDEGHFSRRGGDRFAAIIAARIAAGIATGIAAR